jgi:hypothetical protein
LSRDVAARVKILEIIKTYKLRLEKRELLESNQLLTCKVGRCAREKDVNLRDESFGNGALNDEVNGSNCGRCPVFIHDLLYSP